MKRPLQKNKKCKYHGESGSVIFYIFLGIALFAALSYAFNEMGRGSAGNINTELFSLHASEVVQYGRAARGAVKAMRIDAVDETEISFENNIVAGYTNGNCGDDSCRLFLPNGGGISYVVPNVDWLDRAWSAKARYGEWWLTGGLCVYDVGTGSTDCDSANGAADSDLILVLPWIREELCVAINNMLDIDNPNGAPPQALSDNWAVAMNIFTGSYTEDGDAIQSNGSATALLRGKGAGCFEGDTVPTSGSYHFYQVLLGR